MKILRSSRKGFTLVEIMIVVAIIVLLAAIAIPSILRSRMNANEAAAIAAMKTISWATITYRATNSGYPQNLSVLGSTDPRYLDNVLASGVKQGYNFTYAPAPNTFTVSAQPVTPNITGVRTFFVDESGVIRGSSIGTADVSSPPLS